MRPRACSRTPACSRCSTRRPATWAWWWEPVRSRSRCSCPSRAPRTTGRRSSWAPGWRATRARRLSLAGSTEGAEGRDASRLLASASLAVQHAFGVPAEPLLVEPRPEALVNAAADAAVVVVGLTERWRREGLGPARSALATRRQGPTCWCAGARGPAGWRRARRTRASPGPSRAPDGLKRASSERPAGPERVDAPTTRRQKCSSRSR